MNVSTDLTINNKFLDKIKEYFTENQHRTDLTVSGFSETINNKFLVKIKEYFTEKQQTLFIMIFYDYLNNDYKDNFVINLDNIWEWLGFSNKNYCKKILEKSFKDGVDYICKSVFAIEEIYGDRNNEIILLNTSTFKKLCLESQTSKANEINQYYIQLEEIYNAVVKESYKVFKKKENNLLKGPEEIIIWDDLKIFKFTDKINKKFIDKIKQHFIEHDQQQFILKFFNFLNYDNFDYIVNLDDVWTFFGYQSINCVTRILETLFKIDHDFLKIDNKIVLNMNTFKKLCLKSNEQGDKIYNYCIKLEKIYNELNLEDILQKQLHRLESKHPLHESISYNDLCIEIKTIMETSGKYKVNSNDSLIEIYLKEIYSYNLGKNVAINCKLVWNHYINWIKENENDKENKQKHVKMSKNELEKVFEELFETTKKKIGNEESSTFFLFIKKTSYQS